MVIELDLAYGIQVVGCMGPQPELLTASHNEITFLLGKYTSPLH